MTFEIPKETNAGKVLEATIGATPGAHEKECTCGNSTQKKD